MGWCFSPLESDGGSRRRLFVYKVHVAKYSGEEQKDADVLETRESGAVEQIRSSRLRNSGREGKLEKSRKKGSTIDPMDKAGEVPGEAIINTKNNGSEADDTDQNKVEEGAKHPDDILVFARAVHNIDSSLD
ncbi:hypothetical protein ACH5RR_038436 [Cinchona calisaya]|uniref:Uncharacterized protein n=1 Tax=Cinchona calisaya TaxID=153742 RepID=A0ABD2XWM9_9GENT